MNYLDVTLPLSEKLVTYPDNEPFKRDILKSLDQNEVEVSKLTIGSHAGTHIDAPRHFIKGGKTVDQIDLTRLIGLCKVIDCTYVEALIREADLIDLDIEKGDRILFKTQNSDYILDADFVPGFISLGLDAAQYLANQAVLLVGIDYLGIEAKGSPGHPVHKALLKHDIPIIEGLNLQAIDPGEYELICLPLKISNGDGSPCRAVLGQK